MLATGRFGCILQCSSLSSRSPIHSQGAYSVKSNMAAPHLNIEKLKNNSVEFRVFFHFFPSLSPETRKIET